MILGINKIVANPTPILNLFFLEHLPRDGALFALAVLQGQIQYFLIGRQILHNMTTRVVAIQWHTHLEESFEYLYSTASCSKHHTVISAAVHILPVQTGFYESVEHLQIALEAGPVQRVRLHLFVCAEHHVSVLRLALQVGHCCSFRYQ